MFFAGLIGLAASIALPFVYREPSKRSDAGAIALISIGLVLIGGFFALCVNSFQ